MLRQSGVNAWRMAHNPPAPIRLDVMDRLGMLAMDENRDYGGHKGQGGDTAETAPGRSPVARTAESPQLRKGRTGRTGLEANKSRQTGGWRAG